MGDDDFKPRLGKTRQIGSKKGQTFVECVSSAIGKAAVEPEQARRSRDRDWDGEAPLLPPLNHGIGLPPTGNAG